MVAEKRVRRVRRTGERDEDMAGIKFLGLGVLGNIAIRRVRFLFLSALETIELLLLLIS